MKTRGLAHHGIRVRELCLGFAELTEGAGELTTPGSTSSTARSA
jgi:hypothetical protein